MLCHTDPAMKVTLKEYVPLKQGLRQWGYISQRFMQCLKEYVPLKQGLRHRILVF